MRSGDLSASVRLEAEFGEVWGTLALQDPTGAQAFVTDASFRRVEPQKLAPRFPSESRLNGRLQAHGSGLTISKLEAMGRIDFVDSKVAWVGVDSARGELRYARQELQVDSLWVASPAGEVRLSGHYAISGAFAARGSAAVENVASVAARLGRQGDRRRRAHRSRGLRFAGFGSRSGVVPDRECTLRDDRGRLAQRARHRARGSQDHRGADRGPGGLAAHREARVPDCSRRGWLRSRSNDRSLDLAGRPDPFRFGRFRCRFAPHGDRCVAAHRDRSRRSDLDRKERPDRHRRETPRVRGTRVGTPPRRQFPTSIGSRERRTVDAGRDSHVEVGPASAGCDVRFDTPACGSRRR